MVDGLHERNEQTIFTSWMAFIIVVVVIVMEGKAKVMPVPIGTTGTISKLFRRCLCNILEKHEIKIAQKRPYWALQTYFQEVLL
jgi:hypothetical protein